MYFFPPCQQHSEMAGSLSAVLVFPFSCCAYIHATPRPPPPSTSYNVVDAALTPALYLYSAGLIRVFMRRAGSLFRSLLFCPPSSPLAWPLVPGAVYAEGRFSSGRVPRAACHITQPQIYKRRRRSREGQGGSGGGGGGGSAPSARNSACYQTARCADRSSFGVTLLGMQPLAGSPAARGRHL